MNKALLIITLSFGLSFVSQSQSLTEIEVNAGVMAIQGEMQPSIGGINDVNFLSTVSVHSRANNSDAFAFGGSLSAFTLSQDYNNSDKEWLTDHRSEGYGYNAVASLRYIMTGRDDMRFMKGAFITYIEAGAGAQFISYRTTYPPLVSENKNTIDRPTQNLVTPVGTATLGFQYYFDYNMGINFRVSSMMTNTDEFDGVVGMTDKNDYVLSATMGLLIAL